MKSIHFCICLLISLCSIAQVGLKYYLPTDITYNSSIPTPKSVIGHEVGEWHVSHDKLVQYMYALSQSSNRVSIKEYARSYENRPLLTLIITAPENYEKIEEIRKQHLRLANPKESSNVDLEKSPAILYLGYSVHGNEASGSNAALLTAYHLAAAQGKEVESMLKNTVILLDPSYNPDGMNRFANWVNSHKSKNLVSDPNNIEQNETWPGGRTNHYWFDLNRDWLPVQMPESQGRIKLFHEWKPNVVTDHHEMGANSTYFFQPGIPTRNHPLTPKGNIELTKNIAQFHAKALDDIGSLYYSGESFDDFYYGKGSTYPDINGGIGILFEQASVRSHAKKSNNGLITFPLAIKNHLTTSLSTIEAAKKLRVNLLKYQRDFFQNASSDASKDPIKAYIFGEEKDKTRTNEFVKILLHHEIKCYHITQDINIQKHSFENGKSFIVPLNQPQYRLIKAMFEKRTSFEDSLFYDVSAWTLPLTFNINYVELGSKVFSNSLLGERITQVDKPKGGVFGGKSQVAYAFDWSDYNAPRALHKFQSKGLITKVALEPFTNSAGIRLDRGSIIIPAIQNQMSAEQVLNLVREIAQNSGISIYALNTGNTSGINIGSPNIVTVTRPKTMMLIGKGVTGYDAGEIWHLLDQRVDYAISQISISKFNKINIDTYNTIIMVNGEYGDLNKEKIKRWIQKGGNVIAMKKGALWFSKNELSKVKFKQNKPDTTKQSLPYNQRSKYKGAQVIGGAIFETKLDLTHPIGFGYNRPILSVFRNSTLFMEKVKDPYSNPLVYTAEPLISGYISEKNKDKLRNTSAISISKFGKGKIISFSDNPNFRAFWYGTNKLFLNSLFFGNIIK